MAEASSGDSRHVRVARITFKLHVGPKKGLVQKFWLDRSEPLERCMLLMLEFGEVRPVTFLYSGGDEDPMKGIVVQPTDTADSLMLAFEDTIDVVQIFLPPAADAGSRGVRTPSRSPPCGRRDERDERRRIRSHNPPRGSRSRSPPLRRATLRAATLRRIPLPHAIGDRGAASASVGPPPDPRRQPHEDEGLPPPPPPPPPRGRRDELPPPPRGR